MTWRILALSGIGCLALLAAIAVTWLLLLPGTPAQGTAPAISREETEATLAALKPPKRKRPLIAIVGINDMSETTDYLMPYGILARADVADVLTLATQPGPVALYPALKVQPHATIAEFDAAHPDGADYVIVPAMTREDDALALQWIRRQAGKGAIVIGVCVGAMVVANTGLLDGRQATTHWYSVRDLQRHSAIGYVADRRLVVDRGVATTTGITASMPMALTLIEAIAGRAKAEAVAREIGLAQWHARHRSDAFRFTRPFALTAIANTLAFWNREQLGIALTPDVDEVSLALIADAWSRTSRSRALTFAPTAEALISRGGLRILPDQVAADWPAKLTPPAAIALPPARALDQTLRDIDARYGARYGARTADFVAMQLEYPR